MASKIILFDKPNFEGESVTLTNDVPQLQGTGVNKDVASLIVVSGLWTLYSGEDYTGTDYGVAAVTGPTNDGCYPSCDDWASSSAGKKIESVNCDSEPPPGAITVTGYLSSVGVECQAFEGDNGTLYTLTNLPSVWPRQGHLKIIGVPQDTSSCQQGITLVVWSITQIA